MAELSKWVGNTFGKGEIAHYEQFLLFPKCFQKACFPGPSKGVIVWEWVKDLVTIKSLQHNSRVLMTHRERPIENMWEKEKMSVTSIFAFSCNVSYSIKVKIHHFNHV